MAELRHIAVAVLDPETTAALFVQALSMKHREKARPELYVSDRAIKLALPKGDDVTEKVGTLNFGMCVGDLDVAEKKSLYAGGPPPTSPNSIYEARFEDINGLVFALTHNGWIGAAQCVRPEANPR